MSTAWYRSNVVPKLCRRWLRSNSSNGNVNNNNNNPLQQVQIWETTCIVTNFDAAHHQVLINPANPSLSGVSNFPYFPKGGPVPEQQPLREAHHIMGYVTQWGGMEVGQGMLFAANVVDGLVHQVGGKLLQQELARYKHCCEEGSAVMTSAPNFQTYRYLVHTVPPFYDAADERKSQRLLKQCYHNSLDTILLKTTTSPMSSTIMSVACPLLGAGCRGFPTTVAMQAASQALVEYAISDKLSPFGEENQPQIHLAFGIPSGSVRQEMMEIFEDVLQKDGVFVPVIE